jgi:hypothetical protein
LQHLLATDASRQLKYPAKSNTIGLHPKPVPEHGRFTHIWPYKCTRGEIFNGFMEARERQFSSHKYAVFCVVHLKYLFTPLVSFIRMYKRLILNLNAISHKGKQNINFGIKNILSINRMLDYHSVKTILVFKKPRITNYKKILFLDLSKNF